jgi:hypothetical protein
MTTPIRQALLASSDLQPLVCDGLQALERPHRAFIDVEIRTAFGDSLDIDKAFQKGHEAENRWDYLLGHEESRKIIGLEPHTANNKEISTVIKKRQASLRHVRDHLKAGIFVAEWFWVASGKVDFTPLDKAITRLNENGIRFVGKHFLRKWLPSGISGESAKMSKRRA